MKTYNFLAIVLWLVLVIVITECVSKLQQERPIFIFVNNATNDYNKVTNFFVYESQLICIEAHSVDLSKIWSTVQVKKIYDTVSLYIT
jgi:hypothetical protein